MKMRSLNKLIAAVALVIAAPFGSQAQVCIPTFGTVCFTGGGAITEDLIDNFCLLLLLYIVTYFFTFLLYSLQRAAFFLLI